MHCIKPLVVSEQAPGYIMLVFDEHKQKPGSRLSKMALEGRELGTLRCMNATCIPSWQPPMFAEPNIHSGFEGLAHTSRVELLGFLFCTRRGQSTSLPPPPPPPPRFPRFPRRGMASRMC